jgi:hypothetical protein
VPNNNALTALTSAHLFHSEASHAHAPSTTQSTGPNNHALQQFMLRTLHSQSKHAAAGHQDHPPALLLLLLPGMLLQQLHYLHMHQAHSAKQPCIAAVHAAHLLHSQANQAQSQLRCQTVAHKH